MEQKSIEDKRSKNIVFIPFCVMCQAFQAKGIVKGDWTSQITPIIDFLSREDVNIIQMPCPESSFRGYENGLSRKAAGLKYYDTVEYRTHCKKLANDVYDIVNGISIQHYKIIAFMGIELSPSCAVNNIYSNKGMLKRSGVFIEELKKMNMLTFPDIPYIGINRKNTKKAILGLKELL